MRSICNAFGALENYKMPCTTNGNRLHVVVSLAVGESQ